MYKNGLKQGKRKNLFFIQSRGSARLGADGPGACEQCEDSC